jgi:hypothetical protein
VTAAYLGLVALDALSLAAGMGALHGLGLVRSGRDALRHLGLAIVVGWAGVGIATSTALVVGVPFGAWLVALVAVAIALGGIAIGRSVTGCRLRAVGERGLASWVAVAGAALVCIQMAALLRRSLGSGAPTEWDAWTFWLPKAKSIVDFGGLDTGVGGFTSFASPTYPPLVPTLEASAFAFMRDTTASALPLQHWIVAAAFVGGLASLLATRVRPAILWPSLAMLVSLPTFAVLIGSSLGDEPLMLLLGLGGACLGLWLLERNWRFAALGGLFLAAVALAKDEGLWVAAVLAGTALVASVVRPPRRLLVPALVLLAPLAALVPWKLWLRVNHVPRSADYRLSDLFDPGLLADRLDRLSYALDKLPPYIFEPWRWLLAVPVMLAAALLAAPRRPDLTALALAPVAAVPVGLLLVYWIGTPPVDWYVATSAARVVASAVVLAAVFVPLLLAEAARGQPPPE